MRFQCQYDAPSQHLPPRYLAGGLDEELDTESLRER